MANARRASSVAELAALDDLRATAPVDETRAPVAERRAAGSVEE
ncbi:MAG TPA: hypothetical protein VLM79_32520 [Kofleriaceae bacterium]|nr:hypothetical protein [Kofleriaceae bacterium]